MKKVLIITYYWPPAGGPGVQRVLKFAKYLPEFGWQPVILTVESGEYPAIDESLLKDIPEGCKVYKTSSLEPVTLYKRFTGRKKNEKLPTFVLNKKHDENIKERISRWIRSNVFIPDAKIGWIPFAVRTGMKIIENENIDVILSSSPPHSVQLIARRLAKKSGLRWIADYRDPWVDAFWQSDLTRTNYARNRDLKMEKETLGAADEIVTISPSLISLFSHKANNNYHLISNGYDPDDFGNVEKKQSRKFRIKYFGHLGKDQNIHAFFKSLTSFDPAILNKMEITFFGSVHKTIEMTVKEYNLESYINFNPYISHDKMLVQMIDSDLLLLVIPDIPENRGIVTGKIFEYMASGNYILGIGPVDGDAAMILEQTGSGKMYAHNQSLNDTLLSYFQNWKNDRWNKADKTETSKYSRKELSKKLAEILAGDSH
ncbi:MAG: glycosyltransferase [Calditrichaceae bacterium]